MNFYQRLDSSKEHRRASMEPCKRAYTTCMFPRHTGLWGSFTEKQARQGSPKNHRLGRKKLDLHPKSEMNVPVCFSMAQRQQSQTLVVTPACALANSSGTHFNGCRNEVTSIFWRSSHLPLSFRRWQIAPQPTQMLGLRQTVQFLAPPTSSWQMGLGEASLGGWKVMLRRRCYSSQATAFMDT